MNFKKGKMYTIKMYAILYFHRDRNNDTNSRSSNYNNFLMSFELINKYFRVIFFYCILINDINTDCGDNEPKIKTFLEKNNAHLEKFLK